MHVNLFKVTFCVRTFYAHVKAIIKTETHCEDQRLNGLNKEFKRVSLFECVGYFKVYASQITS